MHSSAKIPVPEEIKTHISAMIREACLPQDETTRTRFEDTWREKARLFREQAEALEMILVDELTETDSRAAILLTYSGSLMTLGPKSETGRLFEYIPIQFRNDVPKMIHASGVIPRYPLKLGHHAEFSNCPVKQSSSIHFIAVCPAETTAENQERRIREAVIFLSNVFVKRNKELPSAQKRDSDQFTMKSIIAYIAKKNDITQNLSRTIVEDYLSILETGLLLGDRASLGKLGTACLKARPPRKGRIIKNVNSGEDTLVPAKPGCLIPKFSFSQAFREKCEELDPESLGLETEEEDEGDRD